MKLHELKVLHRNQPVIDEMPEFSWKIESDVPEIDEPLRNGYSFLYCMEMRKREMMYRDGEWIPMYVENDKKNWYIQDKLRKKDIALNKHGRWDFIGKTREMLENNNAI